MNEAELARLESAAKLAFGDLDSLPEVPGFRARPGRVSECGFDSGEFFDTEAAKVWDSVEGSSSESTEETILATFRAQGQIAGFMKQRGWVVVSETPRGFVTLRKAFPGRQRVEAYFASEASPLLIVSFVGQHEPICVPARRKD